MVAFTDRRYERPDFADGTGPFTLTTAGDEQHSRWEAADLNPQVKREIHGYYRGQKDTQTWRKANQLAARRATRAQGGPNYASETPGALEYAKQYEDHLAQVMSTRGPELAKQFGEIRPGR